MGLQSNHLGQEAGFNTSLGMGGGSGGGSGGSGDSGGNPPPTVPTDFSLEGEHEEGDTTEYEGVIYTWHNGQWVDPNGYPFGYAGPKPFN